MQFEFPRGGAEADIQLDKETYIHRMGRAGQAGLFEVINDVGQFGPPIMYEKMGQDVPEQAHQFPNWPVWAGGKYDVNLFCKCCENTVTNFGSQRKFGHARK